MKIDLDVVVVIILSMGGGNFGAAVTGEIYDTRWLGLILGVLFGAAIGIYAAKWLRNRSHSNESSE